MRDRIVLAGQAIAATCQGKMVIPADGEDPETVRTQTQILSNDPFARAVCAKIPMDPGVCRIRPVSASLRDGACFETDGLALIRWVTL